MPFTIPLSHDIINQAISNALTEDGDIKSLVLTFHDGWFSTQAKLKHQLGKADVKVDFEIQRFHIEQSAQVVELRLRGKVTTTAEGWLNKIALVVIEAILATIFGKTLLDLGLKGREGISFRDGLIRADLAKLSVKELLLAAVKERSGMLGALAQDLVNAGTEGAANRLAIIGAQCEEGKLQVELQYRSGP